MITTIFDSKDEMGAAAAATGTQRLHNAIMETGAAAMIVATGASQFEMLDSLSKADLDWSSITGFHLDEYVGLSIDHAASFRKYLKERFVDKLPEPLKAFYYLDGETEAVAECGRVGAILAQTSIDIAFVGVGENGHLAFNDPPADFETNEPYLVVDLDDACRNQQLGEGWFPDFVSVPKQAISMSIQQIMKSQTIICTVPDERKADAVRNAVQGPVTPDVPASILQTHPDCHLFLDKTAAFQL
ncbi:MAG: glucosamine-6-phosphate deaminase [Opitutaceae bacterium]|nr:glucosamine-6-phosphate deaminase [Opitutaceae bacterium]|tara:strand:- start:4357 stop:5088 length:732 start_codon:yes stop_codon:yes gene_type:complete